MKRGGRIRSDNTDFFGKRVRHNQQADGASHQYSYISCIALKGAISTKEIISQDRAEKHEKRINDDKKESVQKIEK